MAGRAVGLAALLAAAAAAGLACCGAAAAREEGVPSVEGVGRAVRLSINGVLGGARSLGDFSSVVVKSRSVWMLAFVDPSLDACAALEAQLDEAAALARGVVNFGLVDATKADAEGLLRQFSVKKDALPDVRWLARPDTIGGALEDRGDPEADAEADPKMAEVYTGRQSAGVMLKFLMSKVPGVPVAPVTAPTLWRFLRKGGLSVREVARRASGAESDEGEAEDDERSRYAFDREKPRAILLGARGAANGNRHDVPKAWRALAYEFLPHYAAFGYNGDGDDTELERKLGLPEGWTRPVLVIQPPGSASLAAGVMRAALVPYYGDLRAPRMRRLLALHANTTHIVDGFEETFADAGSHAFEAPEEPSERDLHVQEQRAQLGTKRSELAQLMTARALRAAYELADWSGDDETSSFLVVAVAPRPRGFSPVEEQSLQLAASAEHDKSGPCMFAAMPHTSSLWEGFVRDAHLNASATVAQLLVIVPRLRALSPILPAFGAGFSELQAARKWVNAHEVEWHRVAEDEELPGLGLLGRAIDEGGDEDSATGRHASAFDSADGRTVPQPIIHAVPLREEL